ncbi:MAG TPA: hypothetical protein VLF94_07480, partial [Chlamydiales bacterium]|nr:hypothetical protein [Chlamydiales bacterium]
MKWLNNCRFDKLHAAVVLALIRAEDVWPKDREFWITSANDKVHMDGSKHYDGRAVDLRSHVLDNPTLVAGYIKTALGPQFTVIYEYADTPN